MASLGSSIRSAARATFFAYRRVPVRWRLGGGSAALTFVILTGFAGVVGVLTEHQITDQFSSQMNLATQYLHGLMRPVYTSTHTLNCAGVDLDLPSFAGADNAQIRVFADSGALLCTQAPSYVTGVSGDTVPKGVPSFTMPTARGVYDEDDFRLSAVRISWKPNNHGWLVYARPLDSIDDTIGRLKLFLALGVFGGTILALLAGLLVAQRAMRPVSELTDVTREIERTRDPTLRLPHFDANDEVSELARTLESMLAALDAARTESDAALSRQREFVADASHELRTPLTSVLANLELLADELDGEQADSAKSALRATRRMRRLVADLLLLARADVERQQPLRPVDLAARLTDAAAELGLVSEQHVLTITPDVARIEGIGDDLHRLILNLLENAVSHTPPGTRIRASTAVAHGNPVLVVEDDGPGIHPQLQARVFERFVRGGGDAGGSRGTGLGLAIVAAVADAHGATVEMVSLPEIHGTRFTVTFPAPGGVGGAREAEKHRLRLAPLRRCHPFLPLAPPPRPIPRARTRLRLRRRPAAPSAGAAACRRRTPPGRSAAPPAAGRPHGSRPWRRARASGPPLPGSCP
jgi:two-component system, OmpR family, sensor kinase